MSLRFRPRRGMSHGRAVAIELDGVSLEVDPRVGGRITSLRHGDFEVLSSSSVDADNYGSTFWTSPQSDWGWPPPAEIDRAPYSVEKDAGGLTLTGPPSDALGVRVVKRFSPDHAKRAFTLEYTICNVSAKPKTYAPWEVTRVRAGGLTFFPTGSPSSGTLRLEERDDATWFMHVPAGLSPEGQKAFARGEGGMVAHAMEGFLFVKRFDTVPPNRQAPEQGALEIYANHRYVELEVQGCYATIEPGTSVSWSVCWSLRKLPASVAAGVASADLLAFAGSVVR